MSAEAIVGLAVAVLIIRLVIKFSGLMVIGALAVIGWYVVSHHPMPLDKIQAWVQQGYQVVMDYVRHYLQDAVTTGP